MPTTYNPYQAPKSDLTELHPADPAADKIELATIVQRLCARVIDYVLLVLVQISLLVIIVVIGFLFGAFDLNFWEEVLSRVEEDPPLVSLNLLDPYFWSGVILTHVIFLVLHGVLLHRKGQTIGKMLLNIAIVDADTHEVVPLPRLFVMRYLIWDIPALFFSLINWAIRIIDLCFGLREDRRTLHDMTANTIVIKV